MMTKSITRKFLVKKLPDLSNKSKETYQRYYLYNKNSIVIRVQRVNNDFELERKANKNELIREGNLIKITENEFEVLKQYASQSIQRESYLIQNKPKIVLRVYRGIYEGLVRAEVTFVSEDKAHSFEPWEWFDKEITGSPLSQDGYLLKLSTKEFQRLLVEI